MSQRLRAGSLSSPLSTVKVNYDGDLGPSSQIEAGLGNRATDVVTSS
jgi:hypothetical protein